MREVKTQAMKHLGNVLYLLADLHPDYRCRALEEALAFYNKHNPEDRIEPEGPPTALLPIALGGATL